MTVVPISAGRAPLFYVGLHHPGDAGQFGRACKITHLDRCARDGYRYERTIDEW
jgi:hypothetical protein